ncbi:MAG: serine/threonine-protein kinase [Actinomycetes bacterium]
MSDASGRRLGAYDLLDVLHHGPTSTTYRGRAGDRPLAVTVFEGQREPAVVDALLQEILAVARLRHPNITRIQDAGAQDGQVFFVEEQRPGQTLADLPRVGLDPAGAVSVLAAVLSGLGHAHSAGVVHQNVTPRHIVISPPFRPVLTDFAIGRGLPLEPSGAAGQRMVIGTPAYLAPEQAFGLPADPRSDLYSAGVVLFELLTGHAPFEGSDPGTVLRDQATRQPPTLRGFRPDLPEFLEDVVQRVLAKDPRRRHQNAADLIADLTAVSHGAHARPPDTIASDYSGGVSAFSEGRWEEAVELLTRVADADPGYEDVEDLLSAAEAALGAAPDG